MEAAWWNARVSTRKLQVWILQRPGCLGRFSPLNNARSLHIHKVISQKEGNTRDDVNQQYAIPTSPTGPTTPTLNGLDRTRIRLAQKAGPLSPEGQKFQKQLQSGELKPLATLNKDLNKNRATVESIRLCLHQVMADFEKIPRKMRVAEANKAPDGIIARLLAHIWSSDKLWLSLVETDEKAQEVLCYLAILHGLEDFMFDWIRADVETGLVQSRSRGGQVWRGLLLKGLVLGHLNLELHKSADSALKCLFKAVDMKLQLREESSDLTQEHRSGFMHLSFRPARNALRGLINKGHYYNTDAALYDRFMSFSEIIHSIEGHGDLPAAIADKFAAVSLRLHHPTRPSAQPTMEFLRELDANDAFPHPHSPEAFPIRRAMEQAHLRLSWERQDQGRGKDAAWIADKYSLTFGEPVQNQILQGRFWKPPAWARSNKIYRVDLKSP